MKWATSGQVAAIASLTALLINPNWPFALATGLSLLLIGLETYLVAVGPKQPGADLQAQVKELKDQIGNIQLALAMRRE